jgi:hypothetical protein
MQEFVLLEGLWQATVGQPRMILLLSHQHLGCDSCMDMFQTEIFRFAGRSFTRLLMRMQKKSGGSQLSQ